MSREPCKYFLSIDVNDGSYHTKLTYLLTYLGRPPKQASTTKLSTVSFKQC